MSTTIHRGRALGSKFGAILAMRPGEERLMPGVPIEHIHNIGKSLRKYGARVRCRSTADGVRIRRLVLSEASPGLIGSSFERDTEKWRSQISVAGRVKFLGRFATETDAHHAYLRAKQELRKA